MMRYKTELHLHTKEVSDCGTVSAVDSAELYVEAGYSTVLVTDHMSRFTFNGKKYDRGETWADKCDYYMRGYETMLEAAAGRFNVLFGMELRSNTDDNDYLIYGMTEEFMRGCPDIMDMPIKELVPVIREAGMLFFQAHPFRNNMKIQKPALLDGIEIYNGHPGQASRNEIAELWADKFGLLKCGGSDFHHSHHTPVAGIETDCPITSNAQLVEILRSGDFTLIRGGNPMA